MRGTRHLELTTAGSARGEERGSGGRVKCVDALVYYTYLHMCMYVLHTYVVYIDNVHKIMHSYYQVLVCGSKWGVENV